MLDEVIEELTKLMIKDNFENGTKEIKMTKTELFQFCIKLVKVVERSYGKN